MDKIDWENIVFGDKVCRVFQGLAICNHETINIERSHV